MDLNWNGGIGWESILFTAFWTSVEDDFRRRKIDQPDT